MILPDEAIALLKQPSPCFVATVMADGSPQLTEVWVDTDGEHVRINTVQGFVKLKNMERDPRVAVAVQDPANPWRFIQIRGRVVKTTTEGAREEIDRFAQKYTGEPYQWYGGANQERVSVYIAPDHVSIMG